MRPPIEEAGYRFVNPAVHGLNPFGPVSGVPLAIGRLPGAAAYHLHAKIPPILHELVAAAHGEACACHQDASTPPVTSRGLRKKR